LKQNYKTACQSYQNNTKNAIIQAVKHLKKPWNLTNIFSRIRACAMNKGVKTTMQYDVYGIGNALLDMQYDIKPDFILKNQIAKGLMTYVEHEDQEQLINRLGRDQVRQISSGGSVANSMIVMSHFGASAFFSCRIGQDKSGDQYYSDMRTAGLHCNFDTMPRATGKTGRCIVLITPDADRTMQTYLGTSIELCEDQLNIEALKHSKYLYIEGYLTTSPTGLKAAKKAINLAKQHNIKVAITLSDPDIVKHFKPQFHELIDNGVDLIFCNENEALEFTETDQLEIAEANLRKVTQTYAITLGPRGSLLFDGEKRIMVPATEEKPIDTLGAGDMYAGAFLYGVTNGYSWEQAGLLANITSSKVVTMFGPRVSYENTRELLKELHCRIEITA
jgi:sugar/nucleoside kinase (ribokinase family)